MGLSDHTVPVQKDKHPHQTSALARWLSLVQLKGTFAPQEDAPSLLGVSTRLQSGLPWCVTLGAGWQNHTIGNSAESS